MSSNTATDIVTAADTSDQELQEFDFDIYKTIITSFPRSTSDLTTLAMTYHATLSSQGHKDLAAQALRDLLFRSRHELDMAKQLDRISNAIGPNFKMADWIPDDGALSDDIDATLKSRVDLVRRDGSMRLQGSWLIASLLGPIRRLKARDRDTKAEFARQRKWSHKLMVRLASVHVDYNLTLRQLMDQETAVREELLKTQGKLDVATNSMTSWANCIRENDAYIGALWHIIKTQQHQAVSGSEYRGVVQRRALARAKRPRVIRHSQNLNLVDVTTLPAGGSTVRIGLRQRVAAVCGYIPGRLKLAVRSGPPDGPGFVVELNGEEGESLGIVKPTSNYATVRDQFREAWLDWFNEAE